MQPADTRALSTACRTPPAACRQSPRGRRPRCCSRPLPRARTLHRTGTPARHRLPTCRAGDAPRRPRTRTPSAPTHPAPCSARNPPCRRRISVAPARRPAWRPIYPPPRPARPRRARPRRAPAPAPTPAHRDGSAGSDRPLRCPSAPKRAADSIHHQRSPPAATRPSWKAHPARAGSSGRSRRHRCAGPSRPGSRNACRPPPRAPPPARPQSPRASRPSGARSRGRPPPVRTRSPAPRHRRASPACPHP